MDLMWFVFLIFFHWGFLNMQTYCPFFTLPLCNSNPHLYHLQKQQLLLKHGQKLLLVTSLLTVVKAHANCKGPLSATFVSLILASLPLLIHGNIPSNISTSPSPTFHRFTFLTTFTDSLLGRSYVFFQVKASFKLRGS